MKPGTRCECRNVCQPSHGAHDTAGQCKADAVRLVTVRDKDGNVHPACVTASGPQFVTGITGIPMCEACAKHAEGGAK
jgi:hypothetical protein